MTRAKSRKDRLWQWLKTLFHVQGLGWQLLILLAGTIVATAAAVWLWFRDPAGDALDALSDFLNTDAKVWHLLLGLALAVGVLRAVSRLWGQSAGRATSIYPDEVSYFGVLWPIRAGPVDPAGIVTRFEVNNPMCPKCRTPLSLLGVDHGQVFDDIVMPLSENMKDDVTNDRMVFQCPNDWATYDLRNEDYGMGMQWLKHLVAAVAMGQYRTARAARAATAKGKR